MVSPQQRYPRLVPHFEGQQQDEGFNAVESSVHEVPEEEVGDVRRIAAYFEQLQEIIELSMNIAAYGDRGIDPGEVGLLAEYFLGLVAEQLHAALLNELVALDPLEDIVDQLYIVLHYYLKRL